MRLLLRLRSRAHAAYDNVYHDKIRGRIWRALDGTPYDETHDANRPTGFCYSNPFPPGDLSEGDERTLLVSAPQEDLLAAIAQDLIQNRELNIGEMPFHVDEITGIEPDVGEPGTKGTIETGTGVVCRIPQEKAPSYGIDPDGDSAIFWQPEHTLDPLKTQLENNLDRKHGLFCPDYLPGPAETDCELFDSYELIKTYALPVQVSRQQTMTYVVSKWRFGYTVRDDDHRRHLNLALDTGIGERNALGFGFVNITEKRGVGDEQPEEEHAFA